jgi:poly(ADP-ribose) glycohydrolase
LNYLITIGKWLQEDNKILEEKIIYIRNSIEKSEEYLKDIDLCEVKFDEEISMFDGDAPYHVDFANKRIGGGTLTGGRVQEEILFAKEPEAIVSMLFMEVMSDNDAIGIFNTIEYSQSTGYANSFKFKQSNITDDLSTVKRHRIIAIDASINRFYNYFYKNTNDIIRDIHKAYVGFNLINLEENKNIEKIIATGNWGCGAFGGNHELKFIQQWLAASFVGVKRLDYYTFGSEKMANCMKFYLKIKEKYKTALNLLEVLVKFKLDNNNIIGTLLS